MTLTGSHVETVKRHAAASMEPPTVMGGETPTELLKRAAVQRASMEPPTVMGGELREIRDCESPQEM